MSKSAEDYVNEIMTCTCSESYKSRQMADPQCAYCNYADDIKEAMESYATEQVKISLECMGLAQPEGREEDLMRDPFIKKHLNRISLIMGSVKAKRLFVECFPTDIGATHFPNSNFAVKEIFLPDLPPSKEQPAGVGIETSIKSLYDEIKNEYRNLVKQGLYSKDNLQGYEDCIWDLKMILKDNHGVDVEQLTTDSQTKNK